VIASLCFKASSEIYANCASSSAARRVFRGKMGFACRSVDAACPAASSGLLDKVDRIAAEAAQRRRQAAGNSRSALLEGHGFRFRLWGFAVALENKAFSRIAHIAISQHIGKMSFLEQYSV
jgi:hypothetical protein